MRRPSFLFAIWFLFGATTAQAAGVRNFPASAAGPAIRVLIWSSWSDVARSEIGRSVGLSHCDVSLWPEAEVCLARQPCPSFRGSAGIGATVS